MKLIISKKDLGESSDFAKFMNANKGYYFLDKKTGQEVTKWEIFITFTNAELEDVYDDKQGRYLRKKKEL